MTPAPAVALALLALQGEGPARPLPDLPDYVFAISPEEEALDVVHFGDLGPTFVRVRLRIDGRGYRTSWDGFLARLYKFADLDDDGTLTEAEANRPGWPQLLANPNGGIFSSQGPEIPRGDGKPVEARNGKVSLEAFAKHVRDGLGYAPVVSQALRSTDPIDQAAFNQLDDDRDGTLSAAELARGEALIRRLDLDEDEMVDQAEFSPNRNPFEGFFFVNGGANPDDLSTGPFVPLASAESRSRAARRLVDRYDGLDGSPRDGHLSPAESGLPPGAFRKADADSDRRLGPAELERYLEDPAPTIVLALRLGKAPGRGATLSLPGPGDGDPPADPRLKTKPDQSLAMSLEGREVEFRPNDAVQDFRQFFLMRFQAADLDKDGSLDRSEAEKGRFFLGLFGPADRNTDDKLSRAELTLYLDRVADLATSRASITLADAGRSLFDALDADKDGRLGRRELRDLARSLKPFDRDGDGRVRLDEIPETTQILVGRGPFSPNRSRNAVDTYDNPAPPRPAKDGPEVPWFRRMDRNRDGDVSPREFLGSPEDFRKLDADKDGLIDEREAAKGP